MMESFDGYFVPTNEHRSNPYTLTQYPTVTGTTVLGLKFNGGVIVGADVLGCYGKMARFRNVPRIIRVNDHAVVACSGDYADFQYIQSVIEQKVLEDECFDDGFYMKPAALHSWLTRIMYNRRSKFEPLWCTLIVGGMQDGEPYLGYVDKLGTAFQDSCVATGLGSYFSRPALEDFWKKNPKAGKEEAQQKILECLRVLYYRDCNASKKYTLGIVTSEGSQISPGLELETNWSTAAMIHGYDCGF